MIAILLQHDSNTIKQVSLESKQRFVCLVSKASERSGDVYDKGSGVCVYDKRRAASAPP